MNIKTQLLKAIALIFASSTPLFCPENIFVAKARQRFILIARSENAVRCAYQNIKTKNAENIPDAINFVNKLSELIEWTINQSKPECEIVDFSSSRIAHTQNPSKKMELEHFKALEKLMIRFIKLELRISCSLAITSRLSIFHRQKSSQHERFEEFQQALTRFHDFFEMAVVEYTKREFYWPEYEDYKALVNSQTFKDRIDFDEHPEPLFQTQPIEFDCDKYLGLTGEENSLKMAYPEEQFPSFEIPENWLA